ncbi:ABC transporter substrate-binding protein [Paenibacillus gansuensis]|uniref:ABC transporter substrate-binding protein n=1 Tax=Paenibacillus gansuensis TaxID=306542 RepID=A0ABW5P8V1_9BACL
MRKWMKLNTLVLACTLALTACSSGGNSNTPADTGNAQDPASDNGFSKGKFETPVTMTTVSSVNSTFKFKNGETIENNIHSRWVKERLGIDLKYNWVTSDDQFKTKVRLDMSSGQKMPDIIFVTDPQLLTDLVDSGMYKEVSEDFEKYASPEVKKIYEDPQLWAQVTKDGRRYGIPQLTVAYNNDPVLWVREDFLKEKNLPEPKTLDELEKVMEAMKGTQVGNPPLALSFKDAGMPFVQWRGDTSWVFGAYGVIPHYWNKWNGEQLEYGSIQPQVKDGLARLADWYKKGYISADVGMVEVSKSDDTYKTNKSGLMAGPYFQANSARNFLQRNFPETKTKPLPVPAGPDGKIGRRYSPVQTGAFLISKDFKNPEAFFLYLNTMYVVGNPPKGHEFEKGWKEGYDYVTKADGTVSYVEADFPDKLKVNATKYFIGHQPFVDPQMLFNTLLKFYNGEKPSTPYEDMMYNNIPVEERANPKSVMEWQAAKIVMDQKDKAIQNLFLGGQTETMKSKWEALLKLETETFLKIVYGKAPIDEFDNFVKSWKSLGGDKITEEVNEWYKASGGK